MLGFREMRKVQGSRFKVQGSRFKVQGNEIKNWLRIVTIKGISLWKEPRYRFLRDVFWFVVITLMIHYSYRFWAQDLHYWPIQPWMKDFQVFMAQIVFDQSVWIDQHILGLDLVKEERLMVFDNQSGIRINGSCSGDKQLLQLALLLLVFPGKWHRKCWFIPLGMILVHATNILRIVLLSLVAIWKPEWMDFAHDTALRGMFYVVIFLVWVAFVRINRKGKDIQGSRFKAQ